MKKIMKLFVYVAAAAMALASCQKNEMDAPVKKNVHFTIKAGIETKTSIKETPAGDKTIYTPKWDGNEELGVLFTAPNGNTNPDDVVKLVNNESGHLANFEGEVEIEGESGTFYSFYPAKAFKKGYTEGDVRLDLSNVQKPKATSFDPECDILVAKPQDYVVEEGVVTVQNLEFARIMSVLRIDLKSEFQDLKNEFVKSISFTAGDIEITGYARIKLDNPEFTGNWASSGNQYCTVTANYDTDIVSINGESNSVYLVIAPVTIPAGKDLTFEIRTKNYSLTKKITSPEMKFTAGNVSKINLSISSENIDKSDDYSGEYLIAGKDGNKWYAAQKYSSGNYLKVSEIEFEGENILETENIADYYMTIDKVVGGEYNGMYTIVDAGGKYLSTSSSSSNDMKAVDVASVNTYWTIKKDDDNGTYSIVASMSENRNDMRFNYNNGNPRVSCYDGTKTNLPYLTLFSTSLVKPDTTPKIIVEEGTERTIGADGGDLTFTCVLKNLDGQTLSVDESAEELTASVSGKVVTITVAANTTANQKELNATIKCGSVELPVTITQAGKPAEGGEADVEVWSWAGGGKNEFTGGNIEKTYGLGSDYDVRHAPYQIKMDGTGDYFIIKVDGAIKSVSVGVKMIGGGNTSTLDVQGSSDGGSYSSVEELTISGSQNDILELQTTKQFDPSYRYLKFNFTKGSNVGVGPITITYIPDNNEGGGEEPEPETPVYASLADLVAAGEPTADGSKVTVTLTDEKITDIDVTSSGYRNGVFLQVGDRKIEIYSRNVPEDWVVGGTISGTLTECVWKLYNTTWELCPANWSELTYEAPEGGSTEPEEPAAPVVATVAQFLAASEDDVVYEITGVITAVDNTQYGNFYLKDSTGEVYVYGLCSPEGEQKYWATAGVDVGDIITVRTVRTSHNGTPQGKNALYVSDVNFCINPTEINVNAEATTAEFDLSIDVGYTIEYPDGVTELSDVHNNDTATSTYTVEFPANEDAEIKTYEIKIVADASFILDNPIEGVEYARTITITQAAAELGGGEEGDDVSGTVLYSEDFSSLTSWSTANKTTIQVNGVTYTSAGGNMYEQNGCLKFGKSSAASNVGVKLPTISSLSSATNVVLKFRAVSSDAAYTLKVSGTNCTVGTLSPSAITKHSSNINDGKNTQSALQQAFENSKVFTVDITGMTSSSVISIVANGSAKRWYIDDIEIVTN